MKISHMVGLVLTVISANVHAQVPKATKPAPPGAKMTVVFRGEFGKWRQLKSVRGEGGAFGDRIFYRKALPPGAGPDVGPLPPGAPPIPPPAPGGPNEMF